MKVTRRIAALSAVLTTFLFVGTTPTNAEDLSYSDLAARIQALESEISSQGVQLASCDSTDSCCGTVCCAPSCCPAWYFGYELTALRPIISESGAGVALDDEYGFGHRVVLGYDGGSGMGARMRYWFYNHGHDLVPAALGTIGIDMDVLDLEITLEEQLRNWDLMVSGGFRYGRVEIISPSFVFGSLYFEGVGPTVSLEAVRGFGDRGLYLLGNFRASLLYGDIDIAASRFEDDMVTVLENQLGVGYSRNLSSGATLTLRTVWETQFWLNDAFISSTDLGFAGPTTSIELKY